MPKKYPNLPIISGWPSLSCFIVTNRQWRPTPIKRKIPRHWRGSAFGSGRVPQFAGSSGCLQEFRWPRRWGRSIHQTIFSQLGFDPCHRSGRARDCLFSDAEWKSPDWTSPHMMNLLERSYRVALDMTSYEVEDRALESTSVLWMDRIHKVVYSSLSARADRELAQKMVWFYGVSICTVWNAQSCRQASLSYRCPDVYRDRIYRGLSDCIVPEDRARVRALKQQGEIVEITMDQLREFCGNSLELTSKDGTQKLLMSGSAYRLYRCAKAVFLKYVSEIIYTDLPTIQKYGGGAARCMIMELF